MHDPPAVTPPSPKATSEQLPIEAVSGYEAVVRHLRREIALGRIIPGDRLPAERKLAEQYGVARETLRQALRVLEGSGQIIVQRGAAGGPIVQASPPSLDVSLRELRENTQNIFDLIDFRKIIEPAAARLAAQNRDEEELRSMTEAQTGIQEAVTHDQFRRADTAFHLAVAAASRNEVLHNAVEEARSRMFQPTDVIPYELIKDSSHAAHQRVFDAILAGDAQEAEAAMAEHIAVTSQEFSRVLDEL